MIQLAGSDFEEEAKPTLYDAQQDSTTTFIRLEILAAAINELKTVSVAEGHCNRHSFSTNLIRASSLS
eukprot:SAG31_NODE_333_length_17527_cov_6.972056_4_plen_68_part_00